MCRIFGYVSRGTGQLDRKIAQVSRMQLHGGPDGQRIIANPSWGIGSNRLAITDPAGGAQPYSLTPGIYVSLNGEIYNHDELRAMLEAEGHDFRGDRCDGSILPALYVKYGAAMAEYLDGMFSIAVLDLRGAAPELVLLTDTAGMKPVYYAHDAESFVYATEAPALLQFGVASAAVWAPGVDRYLTTRAVPEGRTLLEDVFSLMPGHILRAVAGRAPEITPYASRIVYDGPLPRTPEEAAGALRELMAWEVARLARADAKVCSINSGGLDSALITALLVRAQGGGATTFHVACGGEWPFDERHFAQELADALGCDHREVFFTPEEIPALLPEMVRHMGLPNCAPHALSTFRLFEAVSAAGFRVALTGEGSDEMFHGHARMVAALRDGGEGWASRYLDGMSPCGAEARHALYSKDYRAALEASGGFAGDHMLKVIAGMGPDRFAAVRGFEQGYSLSHYILRRVEPLAMASAVEVRVPFCQPRVMDFARRADPRLLAGNGGGKAVVYGAARGLVPPAILGRPKQPFTLPAASLMHDKSPLMDCVKDILFAGRLARSGMFDRVALARLVKRQEEAPSREAAFTLWALAVYGLWLDMIALAAVPAMPAHAPDKQDSLAQYAA